MVILGAFKKFWLIFNQNRQTLNNLEFLNLGVKTCKYLELNIKNKSSFDSVASKNLKLEAFLYVK